MLGIQGISANLEDKELLVKRVGLRAACRGLAATHLHAQRADQTQLHVRVGRLIRRQLAEVGAFYYLPHYVCVAK